MLHGYNILASDLLSKLDPSANSECQWYFINFSCDILGIILFSYLFIKLINYIMMRRGYEEIKMG